MKTMNISNATGIHTYYANRILNITRNISVTPIVWQDVWDEHVEVSFLFILLEFLLLSFSFI
jgi:hypothetical protein